MNRDDIIKKVFPHSLFGYDPVAVDAFLDEVIREFDRMTNTIDVLQFRLAQELGEAQQTNEMLNAELQRAGFIKRVEQFVSAGALPEGEAPLPKTHKRKNKRR
ncbi:MAG: DivIVA domain-containing protein [Clostridiales bacterium]|nr:DivIVA domain-containing protein [Clostridiales bacterium]